MRRRAFLVASAVPLTGCLNDGTNSAPGISFRGGSLQVFLLLYEPADDVPVTPIDDERLGVEAAQEVVSTADEWVAENPDEVERFEEEFDEEALRVPDAAVSFEDGDEEEFHEVEEALGSLPDGDYEGCDVVVPSGASLVESENVYSLFLSELL